MLGHLKVLHAFGHVDDPVRGCSWSSGCSGRRPISFFMTAGQVSDYTGAAALLDSLPKAPWMFADRDNDADWCRDALQVKGVTPCIPGKKIRNKADKYDKRRYKRRNRIEIMFGRLKD